MRPHAPSSVRTAGWSRCSSPSDQSRLDAFGAVFAKALTGCDEVVLTDSTSGVIPATLEILATRLNNEGGSARQPVLDRTEAAACAAQIARPGDVVVLMGPGDIVESGQVLRAWLSELNPAAA
ncbi:hypothetical protein AB0G87_32335 [Streptomyces asoensis]